VVEGEWETGWRLRVGHRLRIGLRHWIRLRHLDQVVALGLGTPSTPGCTAYTYHLLRHGCTNLGLLINGAHLGSRKDMKHEEVYGVCSASSPYILGYAVS